MYIYTYKISHIYKQLKNDFSNQIHTELSENNRK